MIKIYILYKNYAFCKIKKWRDKNGNIIYRVAEHPNDEYFDCEIVFPGVINKFRPQIGVMQENQRRVYYFTDTSTFLRKFNWRKLQWENPLKDITKEYCNDFIDNIKTDSYNIKATCYGTDKAMYFLKHMKNIQTEQRRYPESIQIISPTTGLHVNKDTEYYDKGMVFDAEDFKSFQDTGAEEINFTVLMNEQDKTISAKDRERIQTTLQTLKNGPCGNMFSPSIETYNSGNFYKNIIAEIFIKLHAQFIRV